MALSYNGWPVLTSDSPLLTTIEPVPGRKFRVRAGSVAIVLAEVIRRFHAEVEPIDTGILDDWSHNYRLVRESSTSWSNHASGTAVDLNATRHPFKTQATANFTPQQIAAAHRIVADLAPVVRWIEGSDPMHWEINYTTRGGTAEAVDLVAARLSTQPAPAEPLAAVTPKAPPFPLKPGYYFGPRLPVWRLRSVSGYFGHREDLRRWQQRMQDRGWRITPNGHYGSDTARVAEAFQRQVGLAPDAVIGSDTWTAAWSAPVT